MQFSFLLDKIKSKMRALHNWKLFLRYYQNRRRAPTKFRHNQKVLLRRKTKTKHQKKPVRLVLSKTIM